MGVVQSNKCSLWVLRKNDLTWFLRVCHTDYLNAPQSFYNMSESEWVANLKSTPDIATSINLKINFDPLEISRANLDISFKVPIPLSHIKKKSIQVQLIANYRTKVCFALQFCCQSPGPRRACWVLAATPPELPATANLPNRKILSYFMFTAEDSYHR